MSVSAKSLGQIAYETRFAAEPARCVTPWDQLGVGAQSVWDSVAAAIRAASVVGIDPLQMHVTGGDYAYDGTLVSVFRKSTGAVRCVVEDQNRRLFIHNAGQLGLTELELEALLPTEGATS